MQNYLTKKSYFRSRSTARSDEIYELQDDHNSEHPKVERVKFPSEQHPVFKKLLNHPKLLNAVEDLVIIIVVVSKPFFWNENYEPFGET